MTPYKDVVKGSLLIIPSSFTLTGYSYIFNSTNIFASFRTTLFITVIGTALSMTVSVLLAFPLSKKELPGRALLLKLLVFTMYFSGGLIPTYMVVKNVGLQNTVWAMIVPGALSVYNMLLIKSYFENMPAALLDAALIDGCGPMRTLIQIVLPLSLPVLMSVMLFYMVGYWNTYYSYVYYCYDKAIRPLQVVLHEIIRKATGDAEAEEYIPTVTVQMSAIVFACIPIICVYPFLQKYFTKGVMLGAVKG
jgi:putative aldouronate transport system permease protein